MIGDVTPMEERKLFTGYLLWESVVEAQKNKDSDQQKPGKTPTRGDHRKFEKFANRVNNKR